MITDAPKDPADGHPAADVTFVVVAPDEDLPPGREPVLDFQGLQVTAFD